MTSHTRRYSIWCYDRLRPRATARDLQGEPRTSVAPVARAHGILAAARSGSSSAGSLFSASLIAAHPKPKPPPPPEPNWFSQILDAVMMVVLNVLEWFVSTIGTVLSFILSGYFKALTHGEPWALVIMAAVLIPAVFVIFGGDSSNAPGKWCGTCGGKGRKHESWCRSGRWGGRQKWRQD